MRELSGIRLSGIRLSGIRLSGIRLSGIRLSGIPLSLVVGLALTASRLPAWGRFQPPPPCKNPFTVEQEISAAGKSAAQVYKQTPTLPHTAPVTHSVPQL